jgi:hypothetical protein
MFTMTPSNSLKLILVIEPFSIGNTVNLFMKNSSNMCVNFIWENLSGTVFTLGSVSLNLNKKLWKTLIKTTKM